MINEYSADGQWLRFTCFLAGLTLLYEYLEMNLKILSLFKHIISTDDTTFKWKYDS